MTRRLLSLALVAAVAAGLYYISRFWTLSLWGRDGLFGIDALRPQGGLLARWLRGTAGQPFELLIWTVGGFLVLTGLERLLSLLPHDTDETEGREDEHS